MVPTQTNVLNGTVKYRVGNEVSTHVICRREETEQTESLPRSDMVPGCGERTTLKESVKEPSEEHKQTARGQAAIEGATTEE
jgi:hypothetical protein